MSQLVYFSSSSENTHRFIQRLGLPAIRIPLNERERIRVDEPYILIVPSYGGGGEVISQKCGVPWLWRFELMGTQSDIDNVRQGVSEFWQRQPQNA